MSTYHQRHSELGDSVFFFFVVVVVVGILEFCQKSSNQKMTPACKVLELDLSLRSTVVHCVFWPWGSGVWNLAARTPGLQEVEKHSADIPAKFKPAAWQNEQ